MTLFIAIFVLLMQFLWKYVDDLVGKGLEWYIIAELMLYAAASLVPLALPLAILLSSIMTFGNFGENYELVAMKSAGMSLIKIMSPLIFQTAFVCLIAFYFSNVVLPLANLKMQTLLYDITHQKPAIDIKEGIFYNNIDNYSIRIGKKEKHGELLKNLMIYDHTSRMGNNKVIFAQEGTMKISEDNRYLILHLFEGYSYDEQGAYNREKPNLPLVRVKFKEELIRMDLTGFDFSRTDEDMFKDNYQMMNLSQLDQAMNNLMVEGEKRAEDYRVYLSDNFYRSANFAKDSQSVLTEWPEIAAINLNSFSRSDKILALETASNLIRSAKAYSESYIYDLDNRQRYISRHKVEWHRKLTLSFACMILFFVGAPLGAIIRKGGLGMPVVVSFIFFIMFHVLSITGEKFVKEGVMEAHYGMWMASVILLPVGIFLTYKASKDSVLFDLSAYLDFFAKILLRKRKKVNLHEGTPSLS
jgi:lipopolysaccharide export system permease protein